MSFGRFSSLVIAAIAGGALVWMFKPAADLGNLPESMSGALLIDADATRQADQETAEAPNIDRRPDEFPVALAEAQRLLAETRGALTESQAALAEANARLEAAARFPESVGMGYYQFDYVRPIFEAQQIDPDWSETAEAEISDTITKTLPNVDLTLAGHEIDCRTDICRVHITHSVLPVTQAELQTLGNAIEEIGESVLKNSSSVTTLASMNRTGFIGELTTTEIFFYRRGNSNPMFFFQTPTVDYRVGAPEL